METKEAVLHEVGKREAPCSGHSSNSATVTKHEVNRHLNTGAGGEQAVKSETEYFETDNDPPFVDSSSYDKAVLNRNQVVTFGFHNGNGQSDHAERFEHVKLEPYSAIQAPSSELDDGFGHCEISEITCSVRNTALDDNEDDEISNAGGASNTDHVTFGSDKEESQYFDSLKTEVSTNVLESDMATVARSKAVVSGLNVTADGNSPRTETSDEQRTYCNTATEISQHTTLYENEKVHDSLHAYNSEGSLCTHCENSNRNVSKSAYVTATGEEEKIENVQHGISDAQQSVKYGNLLSRNLQTENNVHDSCQIDNNVDINHCNKLIADEERAEVGGNGSIEETNKIETQDDEIVDGYSQITSKTENDIQSEDGEAGEYFTDECHDNNEAGYRKSVQSLPVDCLQGMGDNSANQNIDLSRRGLQKFPASYFNYGPKIQHLFLEGNHLVKLPDEFFPRLPTLTWLDLRNNRLESLPPSVGQHKSLQVLLLQGNRLQELPAELGLVDTLRGLQLSGNPLVSPPPDVVSRGLKDIIGFLVQRRRTVLEVEDWRQENVVSFEEVSDIQSQTESLTLNPSSTDNSCTSDFLPSHKSADRRKVNSVLKSKRKFSVQASAPPSSYVSECQDARESNLSFISDLQMFNKKPVPVQHPRCLMGSSAVTDTWGWSGKEENQKRSPASHTLRNMTRDAYNGPDLRKIHQTMKEEEERLKQRRMKEKEAAILQKRRDNDMLQQWRDKARRLRQECTMDNEKKKITDYLDRVSRAPFDVDSAYMKLPSRSDIAQVRTRKDFRERRIQDPAQCWDTIENVMTAKKAELKRKFQHQVQKTNGRRQHEVRNPGAARESAMRQIREIEVLQKELAQLQRLGSLPARPRRLKADPADVLL